MWCIWSEGDICPFVSWHVHTHMNPIITAFAVHPSFPLPPSAPLKTSHCISLQYTLNTVIYTHAQHLWRVTCNVQWTTERELISCRAKRHIQAERERKKEKASTRLFTVVLHLRSVNGYSEINIAVVSRPVQRATFTHYNHSHLVPAALAGLNVHLKCYIWLISFRHYHSVGSACWCTQTQKWLSEQSVLIVSAAITLNGSVCTWVQLTFFQDKAGLWVKIYMKTYTTFTWQTHSYTHKKLFNFMLPDFRHKSSDQHVNQKPL